MYELTHVCSKTTNSIKQTKTYKNGNIAFKYTGNVTWFEQPKKKKKSTPTYAQIERKKNADILVWNPMCLWVDYHILNLIYCIMFGKRPLCLSVFVR